jgi:uncharacterized damage-inducible protein DinB
MQRPETSEFASYYNTYVSKVEGDSVMAVLDRQPSELRALLDGLDDSRGSHSYGEGKWSIKELLSHVIDGERIFAYRILRISRGDETPIEGFEQDDYITNSNANNRTFDDLLSEFELERQANLRMIGNISDESSRRMGTASGVGVSARALVHILAGHVAHHAAILKERYLN